jgi:hypothetical protein
MVQRRNRNGGEYDRMIDDTSRTLPVPIGTEANREGIA